MTHAMDPGMNLFTLAVIVASLLAGFVASISGFGIGSLLTPVLALQVDTRLAIAAVSIPHVIGTAQRFWTMRRNIDRKLLKEFGVASALGGLAGALLHSRLSNRSLNVIFGCLLLFTAGAELTGWMRKVNWGRGFGFVAGALSGLLGGLVGNQGSIRTAGLLAYEVSPAAFVATATTVAMIVDGARMPVYLFNHGSDILALWQILAIASAGVVMGTLIGTRILPTLQKDTFRRGVAVLLAALGVFMLASCSVTPASGDATDSGAPATQQVAHRVTGHDWTRFGWDVGRSSASTDETGITAENVATLRRQQVTIDGTVDSSPIYLHGVSVNGRSRDVFFVTTTYGKTLAINADDGSILWRYTPPGFDRWAGSRQITTATPVADPNRDFIYAASPDGHIQKLAVADGHSVWSTAITLLPTREKIASSLNFDRGHVIAVTGGYIGDAPPYQGHVAILDATSGRLLHVWNSLCSSRDGLMQPSSCSESGSAIWGRAGAVIDSKTGDMFVATGNATWDGQTNWGDASIALDSNGKMIDNYTPTNTLELSARDADLGSTSPALLGNGYIAQGGKDGTIRLVQFGRTRGADARRGGEVQVVPTPSGGELFTAPAVWHPGSTTLLFAADNGGTAAWIFENGHLRQVWRNRTGGTSPIIAGGLLYVYDLGGGLHVYVPTTGKEVAVLECGRGHWNSAIIADRRIALGEGDSNRHSDSGVLDIWRLQ